MTTFVALLRAVNVGGSGKLAMSDLKRLCEECGFSRVRTYIASGNVVFECEMDQAAVKAVLEARLGLHAGRTMPVMVRSAAEMAQILADNPFPQAPGACVAVLFLDGPPSPRTLEAMTGRQREEVSLGRREVYIHYPDGMGRSKLRLPDSAGGTVRNMNSVARLAALAAP